MIPHDPRRETCCQCVHIRPAGGIPAFHLSFQSPSDVLHLRIARLKTIEDAQPARITTRLFHNGFEDAQFEPDDQRCVPRLDLPDATEIWRDNFEISMNRRSSMSFSATAAVDCHGCSNMEGNQHSRRTRVFNYSRWV